MGDDVVVECRRNPFDEQVSHSELGPQRAHVWSLSTEGPKHRAFTLLFNVVDSTRRVFCLLTTGGQGRVLTTRFGIGTSGASYPEGGVLSMKVAELEIRRIQPVKVKSWQIIHDSF